MHRAKDSANDPIKALLDDLEQSIADFDQRLEQVVETPVATGLRASGNAFPAIEPEARRQLNPAPPAAAPAAVPAPAVPAPAVPAPAPVDLLAELSQAAASRSVDDAEARQRQQALTERLHQDLKAVFDYLNQLVRHANTLQPPLPRVYRLDARNSFGQLAWTGGFVDYRSTNRFDRSYFEQVLFQVRYQAPATLRAVCAADQAAILKKELDLVNLRVQGEEPLMLPEGGPGMSYSLGNAIPMNMSIQADFAGDALVLRCRNAGAFGLSAYRLPGGSVTRPLLDGIGLVLLGRSDAMPRELQRIPYQRLD